MQKQRFRRSIINPLSVAMFVCSVVVPIVLLVLLFCGGDSVNMLLPIIIPLMFLSFVIIWGIIQFFHPDKSGKYLQILWVTSESYENGILTLRFNIPNNTLNLKLNEVPHKMEMVVARHHFQPQNKYVEWFKAVSEGGNSRVVYNATVLQGKGKKKLQLRVHTNEDFYGSEELEFDF
ncbi:MAG: hypothetical protein GY861_23330 [bacterium]|nr:hypothetical protein [bacterium]